MELKTFSGLGSDEKTANNHQSSRRPPAVTINSASRRPKLPKNRCIVGVFAATRCAVRLGIDRSKICDKDDIEIASTDNVNVFETEMPSTNNTAEDNAVTSLSSRSECEECEECNNDVEEDMRLWTNSFTGSFTPIAITLCTLCGQFMTVLDQSIMDVSIVAIATDFNSNLTSTQV